MKNVLFVGHFLPNGRNVYETNLLTQLKIQTDNLEVITINKGYTELESSFLEIPIHAVKAVKKPFIDEIMRFFYMMKLLRNWRKKTNRNEARIIILNSPLEITLAVLLESKLFKIKVASLLIDTALGNFKPDTLWNKYIYNCYSCGEKLYKYLDGNMALNAGVFEYLKLKRKPHHLTKIGYSNLPNFPQEKLKTSEINIVYTGSLIYYDGIEELLKAVSTLENENIELTIYGSGPLSSMVESYATKFTNIHFEGYLHNDIIGQVLQEADFLINPRISYFFTDIFGFPSKIIEYLLSGTPVITTSFAAMPNAYRDFVYLIEEESVSGIQDAILKAVQDEPEIKKQKAESAYQYIRDNNDYVCIVRKMIEFVFSLGAHHKGEEK